MSTEEPIATVREPAREGEPCAVHIEVYARSSEPTVVGAVFRTEALDLAGVVRLLEQRVAVALDQALDQALERSSDPREREVLERAAAQVRAFAVEGGFVIDHPERFAESWANTLLVHVDLGPQGGALFHGTTNALAPCLAGGAVVR